MADVVTDETQAAHYADTGTDNSVGSLETASDTEPVQPVADPVVEGVDTHESEVSSISEALLGRARDYGLSGDDLAGLDGGKLDRMFTAIDRRTMGQNAQSQNVQGPMSNVQGQMPGPSTFDFQPSTSDQYSPLKIDFGEDLDESVVKPFQSVVDHLNDQLKGIHGYRQQVREELQALNVLREFSDFDRFVSGLGDDWSSDYGNGATMDLDPQGDNFRKRLEVFHGAKSLMASAASRGQRMGVSDALTRSHRAVHWDRIAEHEHKKLDGKIDRRRKGFSERPTKGKTPAMSPRDAAIEVWKT